MPWPGDIESVTVTWMDGKQETYPCNTIEVKDGELRLSSVYTAPAPQIRDERAFPLDNIRLRLVNRVQI